VNLAEVMSDEIDRLRTELATVTAERDSARAMLAAVRVIAQCWRESEDGSEDNYCADDAMADLEEHINGLA
jgi:hypothetical protein